MTAKRTRRRGSNLRTTDAPRRVVIVTRLSMNPGEDAVSHETQEAGSRRKAAALGLDVVAVLRDDISGDRLDRPGLNRAIEMIRTGQADRLMTYAVDRLGRSQVQQAVVVYEIRRAGGDVLSATEDLQSGPLGDFMRGAYAFAAEVELGKIRERVNRSFDARFAQRRRPKPGPKPLYGYAKEGAGADAAYRPHPTEAGVVGRIWTEAAAGASRTKIAERLNADDVPSPTGGRWHSSAVSLILGRDVYWSGRAECWRTRTVRDADNVPYQEPRPAEERYDADGFPPLVDRATAERARAAAARNVWRSRRADRPAELGVFRFGFAVCGGCGRALSVTTNGNGDASYKCTAPARGGQGCPAPACITLEQLDGPVWWWVQDTLCDPRNAPRYAVVRQPARSSPEAVAAIGAAEARVADLSARVDGLLSNLTLLSGGPARLAAQKLEALHAALEAATRERDLRAAEAAREAAPPLPTLRAEEAVAAAMADVVAAMRRADPEPLETNRMGMVWLRDGGRWAAAFVEVPRSWKATQAALSVLGVTVTVHRRGATPRWEAVMRLPAGATLGGEDDGRGFYLTSRSRSAARSPSITPFSRDSRRSNRWPPPPSPTRSAFGATLAATSASSISIAPPGLSSPTTAAASLRTSRSCNPCPASAPTPPAPSPASPTSSTRPSSTPTCAASSTDSSSARTSPNRPLPTPNSFASPRSPSPPAMAGRGTKV